MSARVSERIAQNVFALVMLAGSTFAERSPTAEFMMLSSPSGASEEAGMLRHV